MKRPALQVPPPAKPPGKAGGLQRPRQTTPPRRKKVVLPSQPWKVRVVEKATGKPVPKARVMVLDVSKTSDPEGIRFQILRSGVRAIQYQLLLRGRHFWTDRQGVAWIPPLKKMQGVYLGAKKGFLQRRPSISGRLLCPSGKPVPGKKVTLLVDVRGRDDSTSGYFLNMETGESGRFRFNLQKGRFHGMKRTLTILLPPGPSRGTMAGRADLSRDFPPEVTDLGDIPLTEFPLLASGRVVDPKGNPIDGARVEAWEKNAAPLVLGPSGPAGIPDVETRTDEKGKFLIYGKPLSGTAVLRASRKGWLHSNWIPVQAGEKNVRLVLRKALRLTVEVALPKGGSLMDLSICLDIPRPKGGHERYNGFASGKNRWTWKGIEQGKGELNIYLGGSDYPFLRIQDLLISPRGECLDPRVHPLDLRDKIRASFLEVLDPKGRAIPKFTVYWGKGLKSRVERLAGQNLLLPKGNFSSIWIEAEGYRPKKIPVPLGRTKVVLEPGYPVRLVYAGNPPYPKAPYRFSVSLELVRPETGPGMPDLKKDPSFFARGGYFLSDKTLRISVPFPGTYKVKWTLWEVTVHSEGSHFSIGGTPREIHVAGTPSVQEFRVSPDKASFEKEMDFMKTWNPGKE